VSPRLRRTLLVLAAVAGLLVLAAAVLPLVVDVDRFRPQVEARLSELTGRPVALDRLRLSLWTGVRVRTDRIEIGAPPQVPEESAATLVAGPVRLTPAVLPLLRGTVDLRGIAVESIRVARGADTLLRDGELSARMRSEPGGAFDLDGTLRGAFAILPGSPEGPLRFDASFRGGVLELRTLRAELGPTRIDLRGRGEGIGTGSPRWSVEGSGRASGSEGSGRATLASVPEGPVRLELDLDMRRLDFGELAALAGWAASGPEAPPEPGTEEEPGAGLLERLEGGGRIRAASARLASLPLEAFDSRLVLDGGVVRLEDTRFSLFGGAHRGTLSLNAVAEGLPFTLRSTVEGVDVARLISAWSPDSAGVFRGTGALSLDLLGVAYAPDLLRTLGGRMRLEVRDGALTSVGLLKTVAGLLEAAGGRGIGRDETPFRSLAGTFAVTAGVARTDDLAVVADDLALDARGTVDLHGPLSLDGLVALAPDVSASMVARTPGLRVRQGRDGRITVPLGVGGTLSSPQVTVDVQRIVREGVRDEARRRLEHKVDEKKRELLERLLRRD
jgi:hypothetical protein